MFLPVWEVVPSVTRCTLATHLEMLPSVHPLPPGRPAPCPSLRTRSTVPDRPHLAVHVRNPTTRLCRPPSCMRDRCCPLGLSPFSFCHCSLSFTVVKGSTTPRCRRECNHTSPSTRDKTYLTVYVRGPTPSPSPCYTILPSTRGAVAPYKGWQAFPSIHLPCLHRRHEIDYTTPALLALSSMSSILLLGILHLAVFQ